MTIYYRAGFNYALSRPYELQTDIYPDVDIALPGCSLTTGGLLRLEIDFPWDGATWAPDLKSAMEASAVHDAFCRFMKARLLDYDRWSPKVHALFGQLCEKGGMWGWMAKRWRRAVILGKGGSPDTPDDNPELSAP